MLFLYILNFVVHVICSLTVNIEIRNFAVLKVQIFDMLVLSIMCFDCLAQHIFKVTKEIHYQVQHLEFAHIRFQNKQEHNEFQINCRMKCQPVLHLSQSISFCSWNELCMYWNEDWHTIKLGAENTNTFNGWFMYVECLISKYND